MSMPKEVPTGNLTQALARGGLHTQALLRALRHAPDPDSAADLMFLERWELSPTPGVAAALRASQLRRANPELAAAIRAEVDAARKSPGQSGLEGA